MLIVCIFAILVLSVLLWDTNIRAKRAIAILDDVDARLAIAIQELSQKFEDQEAAHQKTLRNQEKLIAMLWFEQFGMEPPEEGNHVPSGKLNKVNGLRPRLRISDPLFVSDDFSFS